VIMARVSIQASVNVCKVL